MHFLDAWSALSLFDLVRLLAPLGFLAVGTFLPGAAVARVAALGVAAGVPFLKELAEPPWVVAGWTALWLFVAWRAVGRRDPAPRPIRSPGGVVESGAVGILLGLALLALLIAGVARQDMSPEDSRRASYGCMFLGLGLLHLMLRGNLRRAAIGLAALGLGLEVLDGAARAAALPGAATGGAWVLFAASLAIALVMRVAAGRERHARSARVRDAHDLHD